MQRPSWRLPDLPDPVADALSPFPWLMAWLLLVLLLAAFSWVLSARVVRSLSMSIKEREYVQPPASWG